MDSPWFPDRKLSGRNVFVFDSDNTDFDHQSALYSGLDLVYTQLTPGLFAGRLFSALLGDVSIHIEYCNQSIERQITVSKHAYSFWVLLDGPKPFLAYGAKRSKDRVYLIPPGGEAVMTTPTDAVILVFSVNQQALLGNAGLTPEVRSWLENLDSDGAYVRSKDLAERLSSNIASAIDSVLSTRTEGARDIVGRSTIFTLAYYLTAEWWKQRRFPLIRRTAAFERYLSARQLILDELSSLETRKTESLHLQFLNELGSRRSLEKAFSDNVLMGPLAYLRVMRLHSVRRKLKLKERLMQSIGSIAAEEGFWDWSKFSIYYRRHFGELPSETRSRLIYG